MLVVGLLGLGFSAYIALAGYGVQGSVTTLTLDFMCTQNQKTGFSRLSTGPRGSLPPASLVPSQIGLGLGFRV